jgi:ADP-ribose pyrophosphatase YjhB (NUDIX family)
MSVDRLWYLADEAEQQAEQAYHRLADEYDEFLERRHEKHVSRRRFRTLVERIRDSGAPYGAHTAVYRPSGELLLVRHEGVDLWVLPGGGVDGDESFREAAERELGEEAGVEVEYDGLGYLSRVAIRSNGHATWGVLPVFAAEAVTVEPEVHDPDGEISEARWFDELPDDVRDRQHLQAWREHALE